MPSMAQPTLAASGAVVFLFNFRSSSSPQQRYYKLLQPGERMMGFQMQEDNGNDDQRKDG